MSDINPAQAMATQSRRRLTIAPKILLAVAVMALVAILTGGGAWGRIGDLGSNVKTLSSENISRLNHLVELEAGYATLYQSLYSIRGSSITAAEKQAVSGAIDEISTALTAYQSIPSASPTWHSAVNSFATAFKEFSILGSATVLGIAPPAGYTMPSSAAEAVQKIVADQKTMSTAIASLKNFERTTAAAASNKAQDSVRSSRLLIAVFLIVGLVAATTIAILVGRKIASRLTRLVLQPHFVSVDSPGVVAAAGAGLVSSSPA